MATDKTNLPIDYVTKDYDGFLEMMKEQIPLLTPEWTDTSDSDQGIVILQTLSYALHVMGYYQDRAVNENILHLARTKKAVLLLSKFLGYEPETQSPARAMVEFKKYESDLDKTIIVPKGTQVSTDPENGEPIIYETVAPLYIEAGELTGTIVVEQGMTSNSEIIGRGNGNPNQQFRIEQPDIIMDSLNISTKENNRDYYWTRVDILFDSTHTDRHFMVSRNEENQTTIIFGDGITGMKLPKDAIVQATYRYGGGTFGNVSEGLINSLYDTSLTTIESLVNIEPATGGRDYESLETTRATAPKSYRTGGKIVTPQDLEDVAVTFPGIVKARAVETFNDTNDVHAFLSTETGDPMTESQKAYYLEELQSRMIMNQNLYLFDSPYKLYDLDVTAYVQDNYIASSVMVELEGILRNYLDHKNFQLGEPVYLARIFEQSFFARGLRNLVINSPSTDIIPATSELPKLRNLTVNVVGGVVTNG